MGFPEHDTRSIRRSLSRALAAADADGFTSSVAAARRRGKRYATIRSWIGPRAASPLRLHALIERLQLFADAEGPDEPSSPSTE